MALMLTLACSWISPYLSLGFSLLVCTIRGLGLYLVLSGCGYTSLASRGWKQKGELAASSAEPASRTRGKIWLTGTEPWLLSVFSSSRVNQGYNSSRHTKHYLYRLQLQLLLLFIKALWKLPSLPPVHEYAECYSKNPAALKSRFHPLLVMWLIPSVLICKVEIIMFM